MVHNSQPNGTVLAPLADYMNCHDDANRFGILNDLKLWAWIP